MTVPHPEAIIMAADFRLTNEVSTLDNNTYESVTRYKEYCKCAKLFSIKNVGCVSVWGDLTQIYMKLRKFIFDAESKNYEIETLATSLKEFLEKNIESTCNGDIGIHVGGFSKSGEPKIYHVFFESSRSKNLDPQTDPPKVSMNDESHLTALYNGANEKAHLIINFILRIEAELGIIKWIGEHELKIAMKFVKIIIDEVAKVESSVGEGISLAEIDKNNLIKLHEYPLDSLGVNSSQDIIPSGISAPTGSLRV